jgi:16S rRNA (uracil1498-N3)-methyltransferase
VRTIRCHVDVPLHCDSEATLPEAAANHLVRVLRMTTGDRVNLFNGDGFDYAASLQLVGRGAARALIGARQPGIAEPALRLTLAQGIARGDKMDLILQKATELGVAALWPLWTERTEVRLDAERAAKRLLHWRAVIASACEQCGRSRLPELAEPRSLATLPGSTTGTDLRLILDPQGETSIGQLTAPVDGAVVFAIGPEGGFSAAERRLLVDAGFIGLRLGPRILRTETAGLAAIAALQSRFGDLG